MATCLQGRTAETLFLASVCRPWSPLCPPCVRPARVPALSLELPGTENPTQNSLTNKGDSRAHVTEKEAGLLQAGFAPAPGPRLGCRGLPVHFPCLHFSALIPHRCIIFSKSVPPAPGWSPADSPFMSASKQESKPLNSSAQVPEFGLWLARPGLCANSCTSHCGESSPPADLEARSHTARKFRAMRGRRKRMVNHR